MTEASRLGCAVQRGLALLRKPVGLVCRLPRRSHASLSSPLCAALAFVAGTALTDAQVVLGQAASSALNGRITGTVVLESSVASRRARLGMYAAYGPRLPAAEQSKVPNELLNVVVHVELGPGTDPRVARPESHVAISQRDEVFVPHILPVVRGTTVDFPNEDPFFHNVFSLSRARAFDLGRYVGGRVKSVTFTASGTVQVFCHIHADMAAIVLVLESPFFVVPDSAGQFVIDQVPAGNHRIVAWHERTGPVSQAITVRAGQTSVATFRLPDTVATVVR